MNAKQSRALVDAFKPVPMPVDVTDEDQFPNIAEAIRHARKLREARNA